MLRFLPPSTFTDAQITNNILGCCVVISARETDCDVQSPQLTTLTISESTDCATIVCSFYDYDAPIYTMSRFLPPSKVTDAQINNSILGDGTVIRAGGKINHSVIGLRSLIQENCTIEDTLMMGSDYYETLEECALIPGCLPMGLGRASMPWYCYCACLIINTGHALS